MKILMVSEDLPGAQIGGLGKHVVTLSNSLIAQGHHVDILGRNDRGPGAGAAQIGFHGRLIPGFDYARPGWKELQLGVFNPLKRPYFATKIARAIDDHAGGYDVVHYHGHLPMTGLYLQPGINFVQTRHDQGSECLTHLRFRAGAVCTTVVAQDCSACISASAGPIRKSVTALAVRGYRGGAAASFGRQKTIFVSEFLRRQFLRAVPGADLSHSRVIHNFIDYARLARHSRAAAGDVNRGQVMLVGRIDAGKGFAEFLAEAAPRLPPHAQLLIVGDGPGRAALAAAYARPAIRFLGWKEYDEAIALAVRSQVCVVPSVCEEACSTTVLEALALGKACLALARGGTPELAGYQRYPGQLQLGATMRELVDKLLLQLAAAPLVLAPAQSFGADALQVIPTLLDFYAE
ncbi:glycosyltransferase family 4 protein [Massilia soli]|uniref:Glycosyltransferase family 4 protein n=1 Tax=Massilia soli TaxID=2792854 RepID=A0ABS7SKW0_9BURK|nr:glycosyltransferase family 4 protein [Massilia soli]MBZ2206826.1 glycosyltransferase family 4 protein [Massilia soli]